MLFYFLRLSLGVIKKGLPPTGIKRIGGIKYSRRIEFLHTLLQQSYPGKSLFIYCIKLLIVKYLHKINYCNLLFLQLDNLINSTFKNQLIFNKRGYAKYPYIKVKP